MSLINPPHHLLWVLFSRVDPDQRKNTLAMAICMCSRALLAFEEWMVFCGLPQCPLRSLVSLLALGGIELMSATTICDPNCLPPVDRSSNSALVSLTPNLCASLASEHLHVPSSGHKGALRSPAGCGPSWPQARARMLSLSPPFHFAAFSPFLDMVSIGIQSV